MLAKAVFNWSGGKDSALALRKVLQSGKYEIVSLLTTINSRDKRSTMHAIPLSVLQKQAESLGIPLYIVDIIPEGQIGDYENAMRESVEHFKAMGVSHFIFGDIFLHDVRSYREKQLKPYGIEVVEPLWGKTSSDIMEEFLSSGLKTVIVTTMANVLGEDFIGEEITRGLIDRLPEGCDSCGENGEYHTFCYDGDIFRQPVYYKLGKPLYKTYSIKTDMGEMQDFSYWFGNFEE